MLHKRILLGCVAALALISTAHAQPAPSAAVFNNLKSALESIVKWLKPDRVDGFTDARYKNVNSSVTEILKWSGSKGVALQVNVARSNANPDYKIILGDQPVVLGPGSTLVDALASAPSTMTVGVPEGFKYSLDDSYYVWVTPQGSKTRYQPQFAEGTRATNQDVREELARRTVDASIERRSNRAIVDGMLRHYEALQQGASARQQARALHDRFASLQKRLDEIDAKLKAELERQAKLSAAAATVDRLAAVLQFATVLSSTIATIEPSDRPSIEGARTPAELKQALSDALTGAAAQVDTASQIRVKTRTELNLHQQSIRMLLENNGAPKILTIQTLQVVP